jgi:hypothetical protein
MDLTPLLLLWAIGSKRSAAAVDVPPWPTSLSPPPPPPLPPLPLPQGAAPPGVPTWDAVPSTPPTTAQHPAESPSQRLSELLEQADAVHAANEAARKVVSKAKAKAKAAPKKLMKGVIHAPAFGPPIAPETNVSVASLQKALNNRGAKLKQDGLYGPKTAAAWQALARQKKLSTTIKRIGPKTARVATDTYDRLSVPAIP